MVTMGGRKCLVLELGVTELNHSRFKGLRTLGMVGLLEVWILDLLFLY